MDCEKKKKLPQTLQWPLFFLFLLATSRFSFPGCHILNARYGFYCFSISTPLGKGKFRSKVATLELEFCQDK